MQAASNVERCQDFIDAIGSNKKSGKVVDGTAKSKMVAEFITLAKEIMHGTSVSNAAIHDKLSDNVEFAEANPTLTVTKTVTDPDTGKSTTTTMTEGTDYTKSVDTTNKTVDVYFIDTYLDANTTYKVSFKVVAKTDTAIEALVSGNGVYPDVGDTGTDAEGNDTSSGKRGLWSNIEDSTYLSYQIDSTDMKNKYKRPVVQIDTVKQTVIKK